MWRIIRQIEKALPGIWQFDSLRLLGNGLHSWHPEQVNCPVQQPLNPIFWVDFAGLCPACVPDSQYQLSSRACYDCLNGLIEHIPDTGACPKCSQFIGQGVCSNRVCLDDSRPFGRVFAIGYRTPGNLLYKLTDNLKFHKRFGNSLPLGILLAGHMLEFQTRYVNYDLIVPVPRTAQRSAVDGDPTMRCYAQALVVIRSRGSENLLARMVDPEAMPLEKVRDVEKGPNLKLAPRMAFAHRVLNRTEVNPYHVRVPDAHIAGKRVLIVDDIMTTGYHTMYPVALAFKKAGAAWVDGLVIGRQK